MDTEFSLVDDMANLNAACTEVIDMIDAYTLMCEGNDDIVEYIKVRFAGKYFATAEELANVPPSTARRMVMEGLFSSVKRGIKAVWEWIVSICRKILRFIKSFFVADDTEFMERYVNWLKSSDVTSLLQKEDIWLNQMIDIKQIIARLNCYSDILLNIILVYGPYKKDGAWALGSRDEYVTDQNNIKVDMLQRELNTIVRAYPNAGLSVGNSTLQTRLYSLVRINVMKSDWVDQDKMTSLDACVAQCSASIKSTSAMLEHTEEVTEFLDIEMSMIENNSDMNSIQQIKDSTATFKYWINVAQTVVGGVKDAFCALMLSSARIQKAINERTQIIKDRL